MFTKSIFNTRKRIFVGFEKLIIENNKIEIVKNVNSNTTQTQKNLLSICAL